ncbi:hypothetical protein [Spirosoma luteum]|uniref:hypothetical protein n=1 Tax=Spirosoma luteum TaxID=431553 RepID=UPI00037EC5CB|nr:hypothetical protein [Spirosoma luteum]
MPTNTSTKSYPSGFTHWNRKLHIHVGLFFVLFVWLFSFTGLLLNHGGWKFASFWEQRQQKMTQTPVQLPASRDSVVLLHSLMRQLHLAGEVSEVKLSPDSLDFRVTIPGHGRNLHIDFARGMCTQKEFQFNVWGKIRTLHTFNGVNKTQPDAGTNWLITHLWLWTMDGLAVGLGVLCMSSWVMWYKVRKAYKWGMIALGLGWMGALYFVFLIGLR